MAICRAKGLRAGGLVAFQIKWWWGERGRWEALIGLWRHNGGSWKHKRPRAPCYRTGLLPPLFLHPRITLSLHLIPLPLPISLVARKTRPLCYIRLVVAHPPIPCRTPRFPTPNPRPHLTLWSSQSPLRPPTHHSGSLYTPHWTMTWHVPLPSTLHPIPPPHPFLSLSLSPYICTPIGNASSPSIYQIYRVSRNILMQPRERFTNFIKLRPMERSALQLCPISIIRQLL